MSFKEKQLGRTDVVVPDICLGTMTWGQQNTEAEAHEQLHYAVEEKGLTFLDTAEIYPVPLDKEKQGTTERFIGNWLQARGKRDDLIIASKVASNNFMKPHIGCRAVPEKRLCKESIVAAVDGSLERLQTDYIDLYQIHCPDRATNFFGARGYVHAGNDDDTAIRETLEALAEQVQAGKIRHIGVSNETPWGISEYLRLAREEGLPRIVSTQNQYSLTNRTYEIGLSEFAAREQVGLLAYSVLQMGALTGKYLDGAMPEGSRFHFSSRNNERYNPSNAQEVYRRYIQIAKDAGLDPATMAIAFVRSRSFATSTIIGARTMEQLRIAVDSATVELTDDVLAAINEVYSEFPDVTV